jgi:adenylate cyclase
VDKSGERFYEAELYRIEGMLTLQEASQKSKGKSQKSKVETDPQGEAETRFLRAIEIARKQQAKSLELRATMSLVRLRQQQVTPQGSRITQHETRARLDEAHSLLSEIYHWFAEGFGTRDLQEAKVLLEALAEDSA